MYRCDRCNNEFKGESHFIESRDLCDLCYHKYSQIVDEFNAKINAFMDIEK